MQSTEQAVSGKPCPLIISMQENNGDSKPDYTKEEESALDELLDDKIAS